MCNVRWSRGDTSVNCKWPRVGQRAAVLPTGQCGHALRLSTRMCSKTWRLLIRHAVRCNYASVTKWTSPQGRGKGDNEVRQRLEKNSEDFVGLSHRGSDMSPRGQHWCWRVRDLSGSLMPSMGSASLSIITHFKQQFRLLPAEAVWPCKYTCLQYLHKVQKQQSSCHTAAL